MGIISQPVTSSMVSSLSYDTDNETLTVNFTSGRSYDYEQVPQDVYTQLVGAPSVGKAYLSLVKDQYSAR